MVVGCDGILTKTEAKGKSLVRERLKEKKGNGRWGL